MLTQGRKVNRQICSHSCCHNHANVPWILEETNEELKWFAHWYVTNSGQSWKRNLEELWNAICAFLQTTLAWLVQAINTSYWNVAPKLALKSQPWTQPLPMHFSNSRKSTAFSAACQLGLHALRLTICMQWVMFFSTDKYFNFWFPPPNIFFHST